METIKEKSDKKIENIKNKLEEAKKDRERKKVRYDTHVLILEGQRRTLSELENQNQQLMSELMDAQSAVGEFNKQLQVTIDESHEQEIAETKEPIK